MENSSFQHSVKVPKLYKCAAKISREVAEGVGSLKELIYSKKHFNTKALYALVITTFQKTYQIDLLLKRTMLLEKEPRLDQWLAKVLICELLWGKKQLPESDAKPIQTVLAYKQAFHAHLSDLSRDHDTADPPVYRKPRYVRINTLNTSVTDAIKLFQEEGWTLLTPSTDESYDSFLEKVYDLQGNYFLKDFHIPELLIFPVGTEFYNHPGYKKGIIILQDKGSCLPVYLLSPPVGSTVLDMCAAPGMKTTQLAAALEDTGVVYAVERDAKRIEVLKKMVELSGASCVRIVNEDALRCDDSNFTNVEYILVDPSCSGSGITDRLEATPNQDSSRIRKLAGFQIKILRSALTRYPNCKRVVYSTCSLNPEENEDVVRQVLETCSDFKLVPAANCLNNEWANFGSAEFGKIGNYCLYARPHKDLTNGFFIAVFERLQEDECNEYVNKKEFTYRGGIEQKKLSKNVKRKDRTTICDVEIFHNDNDNNLDDISKERSKITDNLSSVEEKSNKRKKRKNEEVGGHSKGTNVDMRGRTEDEIDEGDSHAKKTKKKKKKKKKTNG